MDHASETSASPHPLCIRRAGDSDMVPVAPANAGDSEVAPGSPSRVGAADGRVVAYLCALSVLPLGHAATRVGPGWPAVVGVAWPGPWHGSLGPGEDLAAEGEAAPGAPQPAAPAAPGVMGAFPSVPAALHAALVIQSERLSQTGANPTVGMAVDVGDAERCRELARLAHAGQVLVSEAARLAAGADLPAGASLADLGTHRLRDLHTALPVAELRHAALPVITQPLRSLDHLPHNLTIQLTPLVGRGPELVQLQRLLAASRLVTLAGAGGIGKTRLALQVAAILLDRYADGVRLVALAALPGPDLVPQAVAAALGLQEEPGRPLVATLTDHLATRHMLLVLDNCEHLVTGCAVLADALLRGCPRLTILATSREALGVAGETVWDVPPLPAPGPSPRVKPDDLLHNPAAQLFVQRAAAVLPGFRVTAANAQAVAQICWQLDGLPLAIELAAARVRVLAVEQVAARLGDSLSLLVSGERLAEPRHRTLRAAVAWSYELLPEPERLLWRRLAVFRGGFSLAAAEAVAGDDTLSPAAVLDLLTQLVDKSLVVTELLAGEARYRLLEPLRQYAADQLAASSEEALFGRRHYDWCLALAEQAAGQLTGPEQGAWLARLDGEADNLRSALGWAQTTGTTEDSLRLAGALWRHWSLRGMLDEGRRRFEAALAASGGSPAARARALFGAGQLASNQADRAAGESYHRAALAIRQDLGDRRAMIESLQQLGKMALQRLELARARELLAESLALWRQLGDSWGIAWALYELASVASHQSDFAEGGRLCRESLDLMRAVGDRHGMARVCILWGIALAHQGDLARAATLHREGVALTREMGDKPTLVRALIGLAWDLEAAGGDPEAEAMAREGVGLARSMDSHHYWVRKGLNVLGYMALNRGNLGRAAECLEESLALERRNPDSWEVSNCMCMLSRLARAQGDMARAADCAAESLRLRQAIGHRLGMAESLEAVAGVETTHGQPERAAQLWAAAAALREHLGAPVPPVDRPAYAVDLDALRARSGAAALTDAWATGRSLPLDQAIALALAACADLVATGSALPATGAGVVQAEAGASGGTTATTAAAAPAARPGGRSSTAAPAGLSAREVEIVRLVAEGLTDRQVATRLFISPRTVDTHLRNIFGKVGVSTRSGLTAWAIRSLLAAGSEEGGG